MDFHPIANLFPLMGDDELKLLVEDIRENGLKQPILLFEGKILDGRNRWKACETLEIKPKTEKFKGGLADALKLIWSLNAVRRHLTSSQLAIAEAEMYRQSEEYRNQIEKVEQEAKERQAQAKGKPRGEKKSSVPELIPEQTQGDGETRSTRAKIAGTNPRYVSDADKIIEKQPEQAEAIKRGEKTIPQVKKEQSEKQPSPVKVDAWGIPITPEAQEAFAAQDKFDELVKVLRQARKLYAELAETPGGTYLTFPGYSMNARDAWRNQGLETCIRQVKECRPKYTVCPYAYNRNFEHTKDCSMCKGLNWVCDINLEVISKDMIEAAKKAHGVS